MDKHTAVIKAAAYIETKGFVLVGISGLGDAHYLARPGFSTRLRIAGYTHKHSNTIDLTIEYRVSWEKDEGCVAWISSDCDLYAECDKSIAQYDDEAEQVEQDDDAI